MGSMLRLLLLAIAIWIVLRAVQAWFRKRSPKAGAMHNDAKTMLRCAHCGTFVPPAEAFFRDERAYCSREHLPQPPPA